MAGRQDDESRESLFRRLLREQVMRALVDLDPALLRPGPAATDVGRGAPRVGQGVQCGRLGHRHSEWPLRKTRQQPAPRTRRPAAQKYVSAISETRDVSASRKSRCDRLSVSSTLLGRHMAAARVPGLSQLLCLGVKPGAGAGGAVGK